LTIHELGSEKDFEATNSKYEGLESILDEDYETALKRFDKALKLDDQDALALAYKARTLNHMERDAEALEVWNKILELDPDSYYAKVNQVTSLIEMGEYKQAHYRQIELFAHYPNDPPVVFNMALIHYNLEEFEQAENICKMIKESGVLDNELRFWTLWSDTMYALSKEQEWEKIIHEGMEHFPNNSKLTDALGACLCFQKKFEESLIVLDKALTMDSTNTATWLYKATSLAELGREDQAYEALLVAVSIDRSNLKETIRDDKCFTKFNNSKFKKLLE